MDLLRLARLDAGQETLDMVVVRGAVARPWRRGRPVADVRGAPTRRIETTIGAGCRRH